MDKRRRRLLNNTYILVGSGTSDMSPEIRNVLRKAWFAGAASMFAILNTVPAMYSEEEACKVFDDILAELQAESQIIK